MLLTKNHAIWASQHDWFHCYHMTSPGCYIVTVLDSCTDELVEFDNLTDLRNWAGY